MKRILFVCFGNICRSPAAEGAMRAVAARRDLPVHIDSAGTGAWHKGEAPDVRMIAACRRRGFDIAHQRARQVDLADFYEFDLLLAMDLRNHSDLLAMAPPNRTADIRLFLDFAAGPERETPDPYFGGADGFEQVITLIENGAEGLADYLENELSG